MQEYTPKQPLYEAESEPAGKSWEDVLQKRDSTLAEADRNDEVWELHGGTRIDSLSAEVESAEEADKSSLEEQLEQARWSFYHSMMEATPSGEAHPNVRQELRDAFIDVIEELRATRRAEADQAQDMWEELGGHKLDKAEAIQEKIRSRGVEPKESEVYQRAIINVGNAKNRVSAKWQELYGKADTASESDSSARHEQTAGKMGAHATSTSGRESSSAQGSKSRGEHTRARQGGESSGSDFGNESQDEANTPPTEEAPGELTEAQAKIEMEAQIEIYKEQGHTDAAWDKLQQSIWQYEALKSDRLKREINTAIDEAYNAAAEAGAQDSSGEHESVDDHTSSEDAPHTTGTATAETEVITGDDVRESTDVTPSSTTRARATFTRAKRASKRLRNRLHIRKHARAQNITRIRREAADAEQPSYADFSGTREGEQSSLGDLVRKDPLEATIRENTEDDSNENRRAA